MPVAAIPFRIYKKQADFRLSDAWIRGFVGGRSSGKSVIGSVDILMRAKAGQPFMAISPTYPIMMDSAWSTFRETAERMGVWIKGTLSPVPRATFRTQDGGRAQCVFRSGEDPESLRGPSKAGIWLDEASIMHEDVFKIAIACLRWEGKSGFMTLTFTPKGKRHWTYGVFYNTVDGDPVQRPKTFLVRAHSKENPFAPEDYVENISGQYTSALAAQELAGEFVELEGLMFRREWFQTVKAPPAIADRVRYWDKACLVSGTMVATRRGRVPIERVKPGDFVLTRSGYKRVTRSWKTKTVQKLVSVSFSNGSVLTGTFDHPVWTQNRGWQHLADLRADDYCLSSTTKRGRKCPEQETRILRPSRSTESGTRGSRDIVTSLRTAGTRSRRNTFTNRSTRQSGDSTRAIFPLAMTFTTRTTTGTTTRSRTLTASVTATTCGNTGSSGRQPGRPSSRRCAPGLPPTMAGRSLRKMLAKRGTQPRLENSYARSAETTSPANLSCGTSDFVPVDAASNLEPPGWPVYDLTVEDAHEFYANGVLVHNSSTISTSAWTAGVLISRTKEGIFTVEDVKRGQWSYDERNRIMLQTAEDDAAKYSNVLIFVEQEPGSGGKESMLITIRELAGYNVRRDLPSRGKRERIVGAEKLPGEAKIVRAGPLAAQAEAGNVRIVRADWNSDFLEEIQGFPEMKFMDQVDATAAGFNKLCQYFGLKGQQTPSRDQVDRPDPKDRYGIQVRGDQPARSPRGLTGMFRK